MKRLFYLAVALMGICSLASCQKDYGSLDGTSWTIDHYEDLFKGSVLYTDTVEGSIAPEIIDDELNLYIDLDAWNATGYYNPEEYKIVKSTDKELVVDIDYTELPDVKKKNVAEMDTFMGVKIYGSAEVYVYFNSRGVAVDLGVDTDADGNEYYYDTTRLYCKPR